MLGFGDQGACARGVTETVLHRATAFKTRRHRKITEIKNMLEEINNSLEDVGKQINNPEHSVLESNRAE